MRDGPEQAGHRRTFLCSVRGFVADRGELALARNGADMRTIHLVDAKGKYISCLAMGENAVCEELARRNEVSIFFARGSAGWSEAEHGKLWLYDETVVVLQSTKRASPVKGAESRILNG